MPLTTAEITALWERRKAGEAAAEGRDVKRMSRLNNICAMILRPVFHGAIIHSPGRDTNHSPARWSLR